ncbi:hypothetical protein BOTBODRAFT_218700 [Botryobasidium botryosum FD-172 SS1]|uniref:Uncharacterized protein n=1 Tax=Botryobasidium botryosum (strain FD-172 SS1) TaxID=930990 RepID=A0A067MZF6_BOTB1|nr:hypothetical protein BOTBODRAFT_218700 [Botryobasidium botryosum FD-172 SS1]
MRRNLAFTGIGSPYMRRLKELTAGRGNKSQRSERAKDTVVSMPARPGTLRDTHENM